MPIKIQILNKSKKKKKSKNHCNILRGYFWVISSVSEKLYNNHNFIFKCKITINFFIFKC